MVAVFDADTLICIKFQARLSAWMAAGRPQVPGLTETERCASGCRD